MFLKRENVQHQGSKKQYKKYESQCQTLKGISPKCNRENIRFGEMRHCGNCMLGLETQENAVEQLDLSYACLTM